MKDNFGRGREEDERKFLAFHKDIIEQVDVEYVGKKIKEGQSWLSKLPLFLSIVVVCAFVLAAILLFLFTFVALANIMQDLGCKRRLYVTTLIAIMAGGILLAMYAFLAIRP